MALIGADWDREDLVRAIHAARWCEIGGPACRGMGHGLVVVDEHGPLFVEVDDEELERVEEARII